MTINMGTWRIGKKDYIYDWSCVVSGFVWGRISVTGALLFTRCCFIFIWKGLKNEKKKVQFEKEDYA